MCRMPWRVSESIQIDELAMLGGRVVQSGDPYRIADFLLLFQEPLGADSLFGKYRYTYIYICTHTYIYMYICMCVY